MLDLPGIIEGAAEGKGRGRQVISTARTCNLILIVLDAGKPLTHKKIIEAELFSFGIRINQEPPKIKFTKKDGGGVDYQEMVPQTKGMNADVCRVVLKEYKVSCAQVILREDVTVDQVSSMLSIRMWHICPRALRATSDHRTSSSSTSSRGTARTSRCSTSSTRSTR